MKKKKLKQFEPLNSSLMKDFYFFGCHFELDNLRHDAVEKTIKESLETIETIETTAVNYFYDVEILEPFTLPAEKNGDILSQLTDERDTYVKSVLSAYMSWYEGIRISKFEICMRNKFNESKFILLISCDDTVEVSPTSDEKFNALGMAVDICGTEYPPYAKSICFDFLRNQPTDNDSTGVICGAAITVNIPIICLADNIQFPLKNIPPIDGNLLVLNPYTFNEISKKGNPYTCEDDFHKMKLDTMNFGDMYGDMLTGLMSVVICDMFLRDVPGKIYRDTISSNLYPVITTPVCRTFYNDESKTAHLVLCLMTKGFVANGHRWDILNTSLRDGLLKFDLKFTGSIKAFNPDFSQIDYVRNLLCSDIGYLKHLEIGKWAMGETPAGTLSPSGLLSVLGEYSLIKNVTPKGKYTVGNGEYSLDTYMLTGGPKSASGYSELVNKEGNYNGFIIPPERILVPAERRSLTNGSKFTRYVPYNGKSVPWIIILEHAPADVNVDMKELIEKNDLTDYFRDCYAMPTRISESIIAFIVRGEEVK